jgi:predicted  nucleic acid-binding Zn-ribbon protein
MQPDNPASGIPGLPSLAVEADASLTNLARLLQEAEDLKASWRRGLDRICEMQDRAKAGQNVDLIEFQTLRVAVEAAEARMPKLADQIEALTADMENMTGRVHRAVDKVLNRRALIARAETLPGGRA